MYIILVLILTTIILTLIKVFSNQNIPNLEVSNINNNNIKIKDSFNKTIDNSKVITINNNYSSNSYTSEINYLLAIFFITAMLVVIFMKFFIKYYKFVNIVILSYSFIITLLTLVFIYKSKNLKNKNLVYFIFSLLSFVFIIVYFWFNPIQVPLPNEYILSLNATSFNLFTTFQNVELREFTLFTIFRVLNIIFIFIYFSNKFYYIILKKQYSKFVFSLKNLFTMILSLFISVCVISGYFLNIFNNILLILNKH